LLEQAAADRTSDADVIVVSMLFTTAIVGLRPQDYDPSDSSLSVMNQLPASGSAH